MTALRRMVGLWAAAAALWLATPVSAKVFLTKDEALELAFPGCSVERRTGYLTPDQVERASKRAGQKLSQSLVYSYAATCDEKPGGTAYFDVHRVRTLDEIIMVVVTPDNKVGRIEILAFNEPEDYLPKPAWYAQFLGKELTDQLALKKDILPIAGATLTSRASTDAVRKVLALHLVATGANGPGR